MSAPGTHLLIVVLADDKDDGASDNEDPADPTKHDRSDDTGAVLVIENNLAVLRNESVSFRCAHTGHVCAVSSDNDGHSDTTGKVDEDTSNGRKLPAKSDTVILMSLGPDQVEEESTTKDGGNVDASENVVRSNTNIVVVVLVGGSTMRLNVLLLADISGESIGSERF